MNCAIDETLGYLQRNLFPRLGAEGPLSPRVWQLLAMSILRLDNHRVKGWLQAASGHPVLLPSLTGLRCRRFT